MIETLVPYLPLLVGLGIFSISRRYKASSTLLVLLLMVVSHVIISVLSSVPLVQIIGQPVIACVIFFAALALLGSKASGGTVSTLVLLVATIPLPMDLMYVIVVIGLGMGINLFISLKKIQASYTRQTGEKQSLYNVLLILLGESGVLTQDLPNASAIPDREDVHKSDKVNFAIGFFCAALIATGLLLI